MQTRSDRLIEIPWPELGQATPPPEAPAAEFERRLALTRTAMEGRACTHFAVYGDREHFADLAWLTLLDPRFEEMLLVIGPASQRWERRAFASDAGSGGLRVEYTGGKQDHPEGLPFAGVEDQLGGQLRSLSPNFMLGPARPGNRGCCSYCPGRCCRGSLNGSPGVVVPVKSSHPPPQTPSSRPARGARAGRRSSRPRQHRGS